MQWQLLLAAAFFAGMGLVALARPQFVGNFFDQQLISVDSRNEVRAVYGGFGITIALALYLASVRAEWHDGIIICVALALLGMAGGRLISVLFERPGFWPWFYFGLEIAGAAMLYSAL